MNQYLATFHTHLSAMLTSRALQQQGRSVQMTPVPRKLSSSCGTCLRYQGDDPGLSAMDADLESIYLQTAENTYLLLQENNGE